MGTQAPSCPQDDPFTAKNEAADCQGSVSSSETPRHQVAVDGFYMAATEVTQAQWVAVMGSNPSGFKSEDVGGDSRNHPVERVSWDDAQAFISRLNKMEGTNKYRLPSEAEWEYAARGGTQSEYSCGNSESCLDGIAWYGSSWVKTHPVGQKQPNRFGLYDTTGNVWEWTQDCWNTNYSGAPTNGGAWTSGDCGHRVVRGGGYDVGGVNAGRSANRDYYSPDSRYNSGGFRLLRQP